MIFKNNQTGEMIETVKVQFTSQGGGFVHQMSMEDLLDNFTRVVETPPFRAGIATAEWFDGGAQIPCYSDGLLWNGSGMPYFERAAAECVVKLMPEVLRWDGENIVDLSYENEPFDCEPQTINVNGRPTKVWPIGTGSWTWDQITFKEQA